MTVKDLIAAERRETEEENREEKEIEAVKPPLDEEEKISIDDEMFCTAAGATALRPKASHKSLLRQMLQNADRA